jgi:hypothetical protein
MTKRAVPPLEFLDHARRAVDLVVLVNVELESCCDDQQIIREMGVFRESSPLGVRIDGHHFLFAALVNFDFGGNLRARRRFSSFAACSGVTISIPSIRRDPCVETRA